MADPTSNRDDLFAQWRKQVEAGTDAWIKTVRQMASQGHVPPPPDPMQFWRQFSNPGPMNAPPFPGAGPVDPQVLAQWKGFLDDWIAAWSRALEKAMGTEAFAEALGKTLDQFLTIQGKARQAAERSGKAAIDAVGLPSREQVVGLSRQMMDLEDRLEALEDKIEDVRNTARATDLGDRLEALESKIEGLRNGPRMMDLGSRLEALANKIDGLRDSAPAPPPPEGDGPPPRRPAGGATGGGTATAGGGAAKAGSAAAKAGRGGTTAGRGAAKSRDRTTTRGGAAKSGGRTTKTGAGATKAGGGTKTGSRTARTGSAATKAATGDGRTRKRRA